MTPSICLPLTTRRPRPPAHPLYSLWTIVGTSLSFGPIRLPPGCSWKHLCFKFFLTLSPLLTSTYGEGTNTSGNLKQNNYLWVFWVSLVKTFGLVTRPRPNFRTTRPRQRCQLFFGAGVPRRYRETGNSATQCPVSAATPLRCHSWYPCHGPLTVSRSFGGICSPEVDICIFDLYLHTTLLLFFPGW